MVLEYALARVRIEYAKSINECFELLLGSLVLRGASQVAVGCRLTTKMHVQSEAAMFKRAQ
jgi:hypothetical protein